MAVNDFKPGLLIDSVQDTAFWGTRYEDLETQQPITGKALFDIQIAGLQEQEKDYTIANMFIQQANTELTEEGKAENYIYGRLIQLLNSPYFNATTSIRKDASGNILQTATKTSEKDSEAIAANADAVLQEVRGLLQQIDVKNAIPADLVDRLQAQLERAKLGQKPTYDYMKWKGDLAEKLVVEFLNKNPAFLTYQTGAVYGPDGRQLLQDTMTFDAKLDYAISGNFALVPKGVSQKARQDLMKPVESLTQMVEMIEKAGKEGLSLYLDDELYDTLLQASLMNTQAKSGSGQAILNYTQGKRGAGRNAISLDDIEFDQERIWELYERAAEPFFKPTGEQHSVTVSELANYLLSEAIADTNIKGNELYFTDEGFMTASKWMQIHNMMLEFNPAITALPEDISTPYAYGFAPV